MQDEFEFEGGSELISAHAPRHWRKRRALQGVGAFHSLQVCFTCNRMVNVQQCLGCSSMQLSFISNQSMCLVLLCLNLVSMFIMSWYACVPCQRSSQSICLRIASKCHFGVIFLRQGSAPSSGADVWGLRHTRTSQGGHCHHHTGTNPACSSFSAAANL